MTRIRQWSESFFLEHPVFRTAEFLAAAPSTARSASDLLGHHARRGRVRPLRRGLWHAPRPGHPPTAVDGAYVAGHAAPDSIVSLHAALDLHGAVYSSFSTLTYFTAQELGTFRAGGTELVAVRHPRALVRAGAERAETVLVERMEGTVTTTSRERTFVEVLDRQDLCGGIEEVWRSVSQLAWLDAGAIDAYLTLRSSPTLDARVGYVLERLHEEVRVEASFLEALQARVRASTGPFEFAPGEPGERSWDRRWQLRVATSVRDLSWEEPTTW